MDRPRQGGAVSLLAESEFRRLWLAGALTGTMRWLETLAIAVFVFGETDSPLLVAVMMFLRMFPMFLFGSVVGVIAERINRKVMLLSGLVFLTANSSLMATLAITDLIEIWHIAIAVFIGGIFWSTEFPVRRTMLGEAAGMDRIGLAMGIDSATTNATRMVGPILGGVLLKFLGLSGVYVLGAVFFALAALLILPIVYRQSSSVAGNAGFLANLREGLSYIRSRRVIVGILVVTILVNLWGFPYMSMVPVIGEEELGLGPVLIGLMAAVEGLGALLMALFIATRAKPAQYTRVYFGGSFLFLAVVLLFSMSRWFALSVPLIFFAGMGIAGFATMQSTLMMYAAPPEVRSRLMGVLAVSIGTGPFGILHIGLMARWLGAPTAVTIMAVEGLIALALAAIVFPELTRSTDVRPERLDNNDK